MSHIKYITAIILLLSSSVTTASVINSLSNNQGSVIVSDSLNNLEWLRFDTAGLRGSASSVSALMLDSSSSLFGFHIASEGESLLFLSAAFGVTGISPYSSTFKSGVNTVGFIGVMGDGYPNSNNIWLHGHVSSTYAFDFVSDLEGVSKRVRHDDTIGIVDNHWIGNMAFLAVRDARVAVPEPSIIVLIGLGIFGIGLFRRKLTK